MSTNIQTDPCDGSIPSEIFADMEAVASAIAAGRKPDPDLARRVRERAQQATEAVRQRWGELNIAANLIRQTRDEI
jgi:hypothetical protein